MKIASWMLLRYECGLLKMCHVPVAKPEAATIVFFRAKRGKDGFYSKE